MKTVLIAIAIAAGSAAWANVDTKSGEAGLAKNGDCPCYKQVNDRPLTQDVSMARVNDIYPVKQGEGDSGKGTAIRDGKSE